MLHRALRKDLGEELSSAPRVLPIHHEPLRHMGSQRPLSCLICWDILSNITFLTYWSLTKSLQNSSARLQTRVKSPFANSYCWPNSTCSPSFRISLRIDIEWDLDTSKNRQGMIRPAPHPFEWSSVVHRSENDHKEHMVRNIGPFEELRHGSLKYFMCDRTMLTNMARADSSVVVHSRAKQTFSLGRFVGFV